MKKLLTAVVALLMIAALATAALATTMYVIDDSSKVYNKNTKNSDIISRLPEGGTVEVTKTEGNWSHIKYINKKGVEKSGWIASKHLSATAPHKHTWGEWRVTRKATCAKEGRREHTCTTCGKTKAEKIEKTKHVWGKWSTAKGGSCTTSATKTRKCKNCGTKETKKTGKGSHSYGEWTVDREPTCAMAGEQSRTCSKCGDKQTKPIDPTPHTFGDWTTLVPLTREADGERAHTCSVCGYEGRETVKAEPAYARKDKNNGVRAAQEMLNDLGYDAGKADGDYGPRLDRAFGDFAREQGLTFAEGWLKPAQLDALVNSWIASMQGESWKGQGGEDAPVDVVLTVDPNGEAGGARTFNWILANQGDETCTLKALLMAPGADHDFSADDMVAVLDAETVKPGTANSLGGSFNVPGEDGALCFCAVVESKKTGELWLSNTVNCGDAQ